MQPYGNGPHNTVRRRRTERYGESYIEPSMNAPQPMPQGQTMPPPQARPIPVSQGVPPAGQTRPVSQQAQVPYQQPYAASQPNGWNQASGWSQPYQQQNWSQNAPQSAQQYAGAGWQPSYPPTWQETTDPVRRHGGTNGGGSGGNGGQKPHKTGNMVKLALLVLALVAVVVVAVNAGQSAMESNALREQVMAYDNLFYEGVHVDGIHLGGMTQEQAIQAVTASAQQRRDQWQVRLTYQGGLVRIIDADDLGMTVDVTAALQEAWKQGRESMSMEARKAAMDALLATPYEGYTSLPSGNTAAIDSILQEIADQVYRAPMDAQMTGFNPMATDPRNIFTIQPETVGRALNTAPTKERLYDMAATMESGAIEIEVVEAYPNVTEASLRQNIQLRGSAYTQISTTSTQERTDNIRRAFELIRGKVIKPGDTFSFNGVVGERTAKNGFYPAIEYAYGEERMGYGGGVCQASTTVYLAAVRANLDIIKREPHSDKVNYTEYGLDATVNLDGKRIDLTFKNNTGSNIYIMAYVMLDPKISSSHYIAKVDIYGPTHGDGVTYDLVAQTVEVLPAPEEVEWRPDKEAKYVTYIDQEHLYRDAKEGCKVDSYKVKYVNGKEVERTFMYQDTYAAKKAIYYVGITEREAGYWNGN